MQELLSERKEALSGSDDAVVAATPATPVADAATGAEDGRDWVVPAWLKGMTMVPLKYARLKLTQVLVRAEGGERFVISRSGHPAVVLLGVREYEALLATAAATQTVASD